MTSILYVAAELGSTLATKHSAGNLAELSTMNSLSVKELKPTFLFAKDRH